MSPRQYRNAEVSNKAKMRSTRFDPSLDSAMEAAASDAGVSVNALVNQFCAEGLTNYYSTTSVSYTSNSGDLTAGSSLLASSVQNYPQTLAVVRDTFQDHASIVAKLSGKPEEEEPHA